MPRSFPIVLSSLIACGFTTIAPAEVQAQPGPGAPATTPNAPPTVARGPAIPGFHDVVANITDGNLTDKVTKGEVIIFVSRYPFPQGEAPEEVYRVAVDTLVNTKLLNLFLIRQKVPVPAEKIDEEIERLKQTLQKEGQSLETSLSQNGVSMDDVRKEFEDRLRWDLYWKPRATEATLRKFAADHRDLFSGTQLRASHILIKLEPIASAADKQKAIQKLATIKKEIEGGTITFAAAANKYSDDPANVGGAGGDLDYFTLSSGLVEEFTEAAFKLKKGTISDPVETPFGVHLIQVTDRKEGKPVDFDQIKPRIMFEYATELQKTIVTAERKTAKIDVKPMPKDLFKSQAPAAAALSGNADGKAATKGTDGGVPQ
jgi:parvulin-like peptidyl-prolyl isomerase